jgi:DNA (cytosine-5)-methyltransferase 1
MMLIEPEYQVTKFPYKWTLKDAVFTKDKGKVFSCFACGGGSTMGYKLAGFDVLGCNEIDKKMIDCYIENHHPLLAFNEPIQTFKERNDLPGELFNLDILDGSPPCSSFSMAGNREKDWGKEKKFREGQSKQVLDTLFFDFVDLAKKLQPKVIVAENVKGILLGDAYQYFKKINQSFKDAGYSVRAWLLNASLMGVPQQRERVFFIGLRKDLVDKMNWHNNHIPELNLHFNERPIFLKEFVSTKEKLVSQNRSKKRFGDVLLNINEVSSTIATDINRYWVNDQELISDESCCLIQTYPIDYNFKKNKVQYLCGMSVPPVMMAQISSRIYDQWLSKL